MSKKPAVGIVMGSNSDWDTMQHAAQMLEQFGIPHEAQVLSAHRMPDDMFQYAEKAKANGLQAIIATDLTRAGLYEAMWQRHTYGTTGARIIIDFKVNGSLMGSEIRADKGNPPLIYYMVKGTAPVQKIEIWKYSKSKGYEAFNFEGKGMLSAESQFSDNEFGQDSFYFMKVVQEDGNLAWSSPVWVQK